MTTVRKKYDDPKNENRLFILAASTNLQMCVGRQNHPTADERVAVPKGRKKIEKEPSPEAFGKVWFRAENGFYS